MIFFTCVGLLTPKLPQFTLKIERHSAFRALFSSRRTGSCETVEQMVKPGWSKTVEGNWVVVVNTDEYPQEVKTVECK